MKISRLLAFAAIGTAIGVLLSTKKGKELRSNISGVAGTLAKKLRKNPNDMLDDVKQLGDKAKKSVSESNA